MKKLALVSAAVLGFVANASAHLDTVNKSGFYVGLNGGYGFAKSKMNFGTSHQSHTLKGLIGGGQLGYQHDFGRVVGGLEIGTDFTKSHKKFNIKTANSTTPANTDTSQGKMTRKNDYSVALRVGYKVAPCWVAGVKLGYERNNFKYKALNTTANPAGAAVGTGKSVNKTFKHNGFVPGIYIDKLLNKQFLVGMEYGYGMFKQKTFVDANGDKIAHKPRTHDVKVRLGYKF